MDWRSRRDWKRSARQWAKEETAAQERYDRVTGPELERLSWELDHLEENRRHLTHQLENEKSGSHRIPKPPAASNASTWAWPGRSAPWRRRSLTTSWIASGTKAQA